MVKKKARDKEIKSETLVDNYESNDKKESQLTENGIGVKLGFPLYSVAINHKGILVVGKLFHTQTSKFHLGQAEVGDLRRREF
jgi:hypothetical protein